MAAPEILLLERHSQEGDDFQPLHPRIGARAAGWDLATLTAADIVTLRDALERHAILLFEGQHLDDAALEAFSRAFGDGRLGESARRSTRQGDRRHVAHLTNIAGPDGSPLGFAGNTTDFWHSDQEFRQEPSSLALLQCVVAAPEGGVTAFASMRVRDLDLTMEDITRLYGRWSTRRPAASFDNADPVEVAHPLLLAPTGRDGHETVYLSENMVAILDMADEETAGIKRRVLAAATAPENVYRHHWRPGDLILYDNAQLIHRREAFVGPRWLKATKIFASGAPFRTIPGRIVASLQAEAVKADDIGGEEPARRDKTVLDALRRAVAGGNRQHIHGPLRLPPMDTIRAGRAGGLPFDSLVSDVVTGCLPAATACYGCCFAAAAAFEAGYDFGKRVASRFDPDLLRVDLARLPADQAFLRLGWNSDPSWDWDMTAAVAETVRESGRRLILVTKIFAAPTLRQARRLAAAGAELRVSISAFDSDAQHRQRMSALARYRDQDAVAIPLVMTTRFREASLNLRQDRLVEEVQTGDFPGAENSLRFEAGSPMLAELDRPALRPVMPSGDLWCGRLYVEALPVPTTTSLPPAYPGLSSGRLSHIPAAELARLFADPVATHDDVIAGKPASKPAQCGVARL